MSSPRRPQQRRRPGPYDSYTREPPPPPAGRNTRPTSQRAPTRLPAQRKDSWLKTRAPFRRAWVVVGVAVACCFLISIAVYSASINAKEAELLETRQYVREQQEEMEGLTRQVNFAATDAFVEQQARILFGYIKEGEIRFQPPQVENLYEITEDTSRDVPWDTQGE